MNYEDRNINNEKDSECRTSSKDGNVTLCSFIASNRQSLIFYVCIFTVLYTAGMFSINLEYFYSRFTADPLAYYNKAQFILNSFTSKATFVDNLPPITYIGWPGYLRLPIFLIAEDFDTRLRIFQITNVALLAIIAVIFSYYLSIAFPACSPPVFFVLPFSYLMLCQPWLLNAMFPLGDSLYTIIIFSVMILVRSIDKDCPQTSSTVLKWCLIIFLIYLAFLIKYTGIFLVFFIIRYWSRVEAKRLQFLWGAGTSIVLIFMMFWYYMDSTIILYAKLWLGRIANSNVVDWIYNLIFISLPEQIIPNFNYLLSIKVFSRAPGAHFVFNNLRPFDYTAICAGLIISGIVFRGMWLARRLFASELCFFLPVLPIIIPITTSTTRYLAPYQVFIWIFFGYGIKEIFSYTGRQWNMHWSQKKVIYCNVIILCFFAAGVGMKVMGTSRINYAGALKPLQMLEDTKYVYHDLKTYLSTLDPIKTRLLYAKGIDGKWGAISGLSAYIPDVAMLSKIKKFDTYLVIDATSRNCKNFDGLERNILMELDKFETIKIIKVYDRRNRYASATAYRIVSSLRTND